MMMARLPRVVLEMAPIPPPWRRRLEHELFAADLNQLAQRDCRVEVSAFYALIEHIDAHLADHDPWWFLEIARSWKIDEFGVLGYLIYTSRDVRQSLERLIHYGQLWSDCERLWLEEDEAKVARVCWRALGPHRRAHEILACMTAFDFVLGTNSLLADGRTLEIEAVHLCMPEPAHTRHLVAALSRDVRLVFDASHLIITLPQSALDLPLATADDMLNAYFDRQASSQLAELPEQSITKSMRHLLTHHPSGSDRPRIDDYSALLGMSARSLQRLLSQENTSFTQLVDEVQQELAMDYLARGRSIQECCWLLSFSETRAFHRAFKRWTGVTPVQWRNRTTHTDNQGQ